MSHFVMLVRVPAAKKDSVTEYVYETLLPYKEYGACDDPGSELGDLVKFMDETEDVRSDYETGTTKRVRLKDGTLVSPWDDRFLVGGLLGEHVIPDDLEQVEVPHKDHYGSFEKFASEYYGYDPVEVDGETRYGYYHNPQGHWDWYQIGGRWDGAIFDGNVSSVRALREAREAHWHEAKCRAEEFVAEYRVWYFKDEAPGFDPVRSKALDLGVLDVVFLDDVTDEQRVASKVNPWAPREGERRRADVLKHPDTIKAEDFVHMLHPISCYGFVDSEKGWSVPGRILWFGASTDDASDRSAFRRALSEWIYAGDDDDLLVTVDCHK